MLVKSSNFSWLVVADLKRSIDYYIKTLGLKLLNVTEEFSWAEVQGKEGGSIIGLCQASEHIPLKAGQNAVMTFTVENLDIAILDLKSKGLLLVGSVFEIPNHAKMQDFVDLDNNHFQLVQKLDGIPPLTEKIFDNVE